MVSGHISPMEPGTQIAPQERADSAADGSAIKLKRRHVEPFVAACLRALEEKGDLAPRRGPLSMVCGELPTIEDRAVKLVARGEAEGEVYYAMSEAVALQLAQSGQQESLADNSVTSALQQLGQRLVEEARAWWEEEKVAGEIAEAEVLESGQTPRHMPRPTLVAPIETEKGELRVYVSLREAA